MNSKLLQVHTTDSITWIIVGDNLDEIKVELIMKAFLDLKSSVKYTIENHNNKLFKFIIKKEVK